MKKLLIIFFIISQYTFAQLLIVHSKNDKRLIAYHDSVKCYLHGLNEVRIAKSIRSKNDTAIGRFYKIFIENETDKLNPDIKPIAQLNQYAVLYRLRIITTEYYLFYTLTSLEETRWIPEMWKKPVIKVVYEELKKEKPKKFIASKTDKKKFIRYEYRINGSQVSKEAFEKVYGRRVCDSLCTKLNNISKNKSNGLAIKN